jgi:regulator of protease activity HflC (stomatin/prohibitin superfamily)
VILVFSPVDRMVRISLRQEALEVPPQDIITRDNVTLKVNAVIFLRVIDPNKAVVEVSNYAYQTSQFAQTTLRSVLGEQELDELLAHRDKINLRLQSILDTHTAPWGVKVANVEVKQVDMPESMLRAMAKQAEAEREKRSKIIHAEGEFSAAQRLVDAAHLLSTEPASIQLRYLQTLTEIGVEKNTTVVFPVPIDFFSGLQNLLAAESTGCAGKRLEVNANSHVHGAAGYGDHAWHGPHAGHFFRFVLVCAFSLPSAFRSAEKLPDR